MILWDWVSHEYIPTYGQCTLFFKVEDKFFVTISEYPILVLPYVLWTLTQAVPLIVIVICYSIIFYEVRLQIRRSRYIGGAGSLKSYKAITTIFLIIVTFLITWLPEYIYDLLIVLHYIDPQHESEETFSISLITRWLYYLSPTVDPYIYGIRHQRLQSAIKQTFCLSKGEFIPSNSDVISRTFRCLSRAVTVTVPEIQHRSNKILDSVTGSVSSMFTTNHLSEGYSSTFNISTTYPQNSPARWRKITRDRQRPKSLNITDLRKLEQSPHIRRPLSQQLCNRKVSVVLENDL